MNSVVSLRLTIAKTLLGILAVAVIFQQFCANYQHKIIRNSVRAKLRVSAKNNQLKFVSSSDNKVIGFGLDGEKS